MNGMHRCLAEVSFDSDIRTRADDDEFDLITRGEDGNPPHVQRMMRERAEARAAQDRARWTARRQANLEEAQAHMDRVHSGRQFDIGNDEEEDILSEDEGINRGADEIFEDSDNDYNGIFDIDDDMDYCIMLFLMKIMILFLVSLLILPHHLLLLVLVALNPPLLLLLDLLMVIIVVVVQDVVEDEQVLVVIAWQLEYYCSSSFKCWSSIGLHYYSS